MVTFQTRIRFVILNSDSAFTETIYWKLGETQLFSDRKNAQKYFLSASFKHIFSRKHASKSRLGYRKEVSDLHAKSNYGCCSVLP